MVGDNVLYYAVDHSPSYLWDSATWEISEALLPFLRTVHGGPAAWDRDPTMRRAIEIRDGRHPEPRDPVLPGPRPSAPAPVPARLTPPPAAPEGPPLAASAEVAA